jgi:hypothetical protein
MPLIILIVVFIVIDIAILLYKRKVKKRNASLPYVRVYDFVTRRYYNIPACELSSDMIEVKIEGDTHKSWVRKDQLRKGEYRHPEFDDVRKEKIRTIKANLDEVCCQSREEWEDGFRRDVNPDKEIELWLRIGDVYTNTIAGNNYNETQRQDVFDIVLACSRIDTYDAIYPSLNLTSIDKQMAKPIIRKCYKAFH